MHKKCSGISLLELMLVLLVITILVFSSLRYYSVVEENLKITQAEDMINHIVDASYRWNEGNSDWQQLNLQQLINQDLLPASAAISPWTTPLNLQGSAPNQVVVSVRSIRVTTCHALQEKFKHLAQKTNCVQEKAGGYTFSAFFGEGSL